MKIIQISDIHIGAANEETKGIDVRENFQRVFSNALAETPDVLVISGDLCYRAPHKEIYNWVEELIEGAQCPIYIIPGNHDDASMINEKYLPAQADINGQRYFYLNLQDRDVFFLDTTIGSLGEEQWTWLASGLNEAQDALIFMHHPPVLCNIPFMDESHAFKQIERFAQTIHDAQLPHVHVFSGHYHIHKSVHALNYSVHLVPSTIFQLRQDVPHFEIDHYHVGYRIIDIANGNIGHRVVYC